MKQVLINLIKCVLTHTERGLINIKAAFEYEKEELIVQITDNKIKKQFKY